MFHVERLAGGIAVPNGLADQGGTRRRTVPRGTSGRPPSTVRTWWFTTVNLAPSLFHVEPARELTESLFHVQRASGLTKSPFHVEHIRSALWGPGGHGDTP